MAETQDQGHQTSAEGEHKKGRFEPKVPVNLQPPKSDSISTEHLAKCNGKRPLLGVSVPCHNTTYGATTITCLQPLIPTYCIVGLNADYPTYVAIKGKVYDVTGNKAYGPEGPYKAFAGHDASRALGKTSTKAEDVKPEWDDLPDNEKKTLDDWVTFFSKRYNIVGVVEGARNME